MQVQSGGERVAYHAAHISARCPCVHAINFSFVRGEWEAEIALQLARECVNISRRI